MHNPSERSEATTCGSAGPSEAAIRAARGLVLSYCHHEGRARITKDDCEECVAIALDAFAEAARRDEREACAEVCMKRADRHHEASVEARTKVEEIGDQHYETHWQEKRLQSEARMCAHLIRARGQPS